MMTALVSIASVSILEGNTGTQNAAVTVNVSEPHSNAVTVDYSTANGTATSGLDYKAVAGTLTFAKNEMSKTILVPVTGDRLVESTETFFVNLKNAKGGAKIANSQAAVTILDDERSISINDVSVQEGNSGTKSVTFAVTLSAAYDAPVSVNYATTDDSAAAGSDYVVCTGTVTFQPGQTSVPVTVQVNGDRLVEQNETFSVSLSGPSSNAYINRATGIGTIMDDESRISIAGAIQLEAQSGTTPFNFTVSLSAAYDQAVTVNYTTADGTAKAGTDYTAAAGSLIFAPGETSKTIPVAVSGNASAAPDKTFFVNMSTPNSYAAIINGGQAVGTIVDREPRISVYDAYNNYATSFTFTVSLSAAYDHEVTVNFNTLDGTATAGVDYVAQSGTLTFAPGVTSQTITIDVLDQNSMYDKYFSVQLSGVSSNALLANESAFGYGDGYGYYDPGYYYDYGYYDYWYYG
jgi:chitinase